MARLDDDSYRWTAADPQLRWLRLNARGLDVTVEETSESLAALALQGPLSRAVLEAASGADLSGPGLLPPAGADRSATSPWTSAGPATPATWATSCGSPRIGRSALWDALMETGRAYALRPAGIWALDVARVEAGLIMLDVDYTSATHAADPGAGVLARGAGAGPARWTSPRRRRSRVGRRSLRERDAGGPPRRLVGLELDWEDLERLTARHGLSPALSPSAWRGQIPVFAGGRQIGRATSGTWSPVLKKLIALASVEAAYEPAGTPVADGVDRGGRPRPDPGHRGAPLPFYDPPHKRS